MRIGYFGGPTYLPAQPLAWKEISDHTNLGFLGTWACDLTTLIDWHIRSIKAGVALGIVEWCLGIDVLVYLLPKFTPRDDARTNLRAYLTALRDADVLKYVIALYPIDEPNGLIQEPQVLLTNRTIREMLVEFNHGDIKLGVCYGGLERPAWWQRFSTKWLRIGHWQDKAMPLPGLMDYDIIGGDAYELGAEILLQYDRLLPRLGQGQQVMLFAGGCSPWKQDPAPFIAWAKAHVDRVFAVVPFTWFDRENMPRSGIRNNGMADAYRADCKSLYQDD